MNTHPEVDCMCRLCGLLVSDGSLSGLTCSKSGRLDCSWTSWTCTMCERVCVWCMRFGLCCGLQPA